MKVLTLKQPWATLVAEGIKKYEFRSWRTKYRGKLLIHAGSGIDKKEMDKYKNLNMPFPSKKIIAEKNIAYGDKYRSGYAWKLTNVKKLNINKSIMDNLAYGIMI